jgi:hypothetical protein
MKNRSDKIISFHAVSKKRKNPQKKIMSEISLCMIVLVALMGISELLVFKSYSMSNPYELASPGLPMM